MKPDRSNDSKKKKVVVAVELTEDNKVKRTYSMCIEDYSSNSLRKIFETHISAGAEITTDEWTEYRPLPKITIYHRYPVVADKTLSSSTISSTKSSHGFALLIHRLINYTRTSI